MLLRSGNASTVEDTKKLVEEYDALADDAYKNGSVFAMPLVSPDVLGV